MRRKSYVERKAAFRRLLRGSRGIPADLVRLSCEKCGRGGQYGRRQSGHAAKSRFPKRYSRADLSCWD
jgi:hypothetical protein